jgi:mannose-6-phosphate isomerase-like protein (cupin superfamily)
MLGHFRHIAPSCAIVSGSRVIRSSDFRWNGVDLRDYKPAGALHQGITRQVLLGDTTEDGGLQFETRYFEIEPGGHSTLERHAHPHVVVVIRGHGKVVLDETLADIKVPDCIYVAPWSYHQFHALKNETLGFLCIVDRNRDRPCLPSDEDLDRLRSNPELGAWIKS